jgi:hypothetical protein
VLILSALFAFCEQNYFFYFPIDFSLSLSLTIKHTDIILIRLQSMNEVRNSDGKLVCRIDKKERMIEIVNKGCITEIRFHPDDTPEIEHYRLDKITKKIKQ